MVRAAKPPSPSANRTDLTVPNVQAPAQQYGERQQQQQAQRAIPIASPPPTPGAPTAPAPQPPPGGQATPQPQPSLPPVSGPGILPWMHPTTRPNEPVTAGLPTGAGPGPEALTGVGAIAANQAVEQGTLKNLLGSLANGPTSSAAIRDLAAVAGAG